MCHKLVTGSHEKIGVGYKMIHKNVSQISHIILSILFLWVSEWVIVVQKPSLHMLPLEVMVRLSKLTNLFWVSEWLFIKASSAIFQLYHGKNIVFMNKLKIKLFC